MGEKGEKDKMKQWLKYMTVACGFFVMAVVCFPTNGNLVSAEGTVSGNTAQTENESIMPVENTSWTLTIEYDLVGGVWNKTGTDTIESTIEAGSGGAFTFNLTKEIPTKMSYKFLGWECKTLGDEIFNSTDEITYISTSDIAEITLTAVWKDNPCVVNIVYDNGEGTKLEDYGQSIIQQKNEDSEEYETSFTVTVTSNEPGKEGYRLVGWKDADGKTYTAGNTVTYNWADYSSGDSDNPQVITFTASWEQEITPDEGENKEDDTESGFLEEGATPTNGENKLKANTKYVLDSGTWTVEGDPTIYEGGSEFYVEVEGTYLFKQSQ